MEALRVEGLCKNYGGVSALTNIFFSIKVGERLAIIGPNGAGKTTLFNILDGQLRADDGQFFFFGQDISRMPTYGRTHLGLVRSFQLTTLFSNLTVLNNTMLAIHGILPSRFEMFRPIISYKDLYDKAHELLDSMDLWGRRDELVEAISYGEQRKLEIALCLAAKPKLLLLDEPSCGLTADESKDISTRIRDLGTDVTVILIAHDIDLVFDVAERIVVLHHGEIVADGTCDEIQCNSLVKEIYMGSEATVG